VDINLCAGNEELSNILQFVSGLGPRKAQAIITKINRTGGKLQARADLILKKMCSERVFINCASFIRVKERHFLRVPNLIIDPLDDTRIHPEDYDIARKMAADALDLDDDAVDQDNPSQHVAEIMENESDRLLMLMLDDYADELERSEHKLKKIALNEMRDELMAPYIEKRRRFEGATVDEIFTMLTTETNESLHAGSLVNVTVQRAKERFIFCQHQSGMEAIVHAKNVDLPAHMEHEPQLQAFFPPGMVIPARVMEVNKERLSLELDIRKTAILDRSFDVILRDPCFSIEREEKDLFTSSMSATKKKGAAQVRSIQHPYFKNLDYKAAEEYLSRRPRGDFVVRPSTKGNDHISITWKVDNDIYQHIGMFLGWRLKCEVQGIHVRCHDRCFGKSKGE
jgi:transcription elongation factor SPT6